MQHKHCDEVMGTHFSLCIEASELECERVKALSEEVFEEIKRLESLLSRFVEDSDVSRINRLRNGETLMISPETYQCLLCSVEANQLTLGHFDVAFRSERLKDPVPCFSLPDKLRIRSEVDSLKIDFGGIGKGFALQHVREILLRYDYSHALLCADTSTILSMTPSEKQGWPIVFELPEGDHHVTLKNSSVSCSGKAVQGEHIFHVKNREYVTKAERAWVITESPVFADAFSTAIMTMNKTEFMKFESQKICQCWSLFLE